MKNVLLFCQATLLLCFFSPGSMMAQNQKSVIHLSMKNATLKEVIWEIEKQSGFVFAYNADDLLKAGKVNVEIDGKTVREALDICLKNIGLSYVVQDNIIVIKQKEKEFPEMKKITVRGKVVDKEGIPLPGVTILLKGTTLGVVTDIDGKYSLTLPEVDMPVLVFSFVGMKGQEVKYTGKNEINVVMEEDVKAMEEVVVTGIFRKAKESFTGAATMVTDKELAMAGNRSIVSTLRNLDPSFNLSESLNFGSDPNHLPTITVRGMSSLSSEIRSVTEESTNLREANQPLFILDGFEISLERFVDIDESTVASITILKDASATAIYGSRGSNGVVVITSKVPELGKLRLSYTLNLNMETPDLSSYNLMNAYEKLEFEKASGLYTAANVADQPAFNEIYNRRKMYAERGVNTYWLKYPVRTGITANHSVGLSGGDQSFRYSARVSYRLNKGVMKGSERGAFNASLLFSYNFKKFSFKNDMLISTTKGTNSPYGGYSQYGNLNPYLRPYDDDGNIVKILETSNFLNGGSIPNPLYDALLAQKDESKNFSIIDNLSIEYSPIPGLRIAGRFNVTSIHRRGDKYLPADHTSFDNYTEDRYGEKGSYSYSPGESIKYEGDITLHYNKEFGRHMLSAGLSYSISSSKEESYAIKAVGLTAPNADYLGMANQYASGRPSSSDSKNRRVGGIGMINYTYDHRFFVDGSIKIEGSSQFGADRRMAPFWSVGAGWNVNNEKFLKDQQILSTFRLRLSYGSTGSQGFNSYQAVTTYKSVDGKGYNGSYGVLLMGLGNPDLGWQKTNQLNGGFELGFLENRFRLNFDAYSKITNDLLTDIYLPTASGFESYKANVGKVSNMGYEVTLNCAIFKSIDPKGFFLSIGTSAFHNVNKVKKISNSIAFLNDKILSEAGVNPSFLYKEGESMNTIYAVKSLGIDPGNGKEIFVTRDGSLSYVWDANDQVPCGNTDPMISGNLNVNVTYKNITLNAIFGYTYGGQNYNYTLVGKVENIDPAKNADRRVLYDRWRNPGDIVSYKGVDNKTTTKASSRFVMDDNIFELRNVSLSYVLPTEWTDKFGIGRVFISANTEDLFRISSIKQERGLAYPFSRKFSFSLTATF